MFEGYETNIERNNGYMRQGSEQISQRSCLLYRGWRILSLYVETHATYWRENIFARSWPHGLISNGHLEVTLPAYVAKWVLAKSSADDVMDDARNFLPRQSQNSKKQSFEEHTITQSKTIASKLVRSNAYT